MNNVFNRKIGRQSIKNWGNKARKLEFIGRKINKKVKLMKIKLYLEKKEQKQISKKI